MSHYNHVDEKGKPTDLSGTIFRNPQSPLHGGSRTKRSLAVEEASCTACGHHKRFVNLALNAKWDAKCARCRKEVEV